MCVLAVTMGGHWRCWWYGTKRTVREHVMCGCQWVVRITAFDAINYDAIRLVITFEGDIMFECFSAPIHRWDVSLTLMTGNWGNGQNYFCRRSFFTNPTTNASNSYTQMPFCPKHKHKYFVSFHYFRFNEENSIHKYICWKAMCPIPTHNSTHKWEWEGGESHPASRRTRMEKSNHIYRRSNKDYIYPLNLTLFRKIHRAYITNLILWARV